jgi:microsomal dipeptidase-like Zn-dependent dipeptidase
VALALSAADVRRIHRQGKIAVLESFLNARSLGANLDGIDDFYKSGVRLFGFVHAGNNAFADSSRPEAFLRELRALYPNASVPEYVDHIDYIIRRIGIDHVGIGTDFNHGSGIVGFEDESEAPNVTRELVRRGYDEAQIAKIWGGNFLRVFGEVEAVSRKLKKS